MGQIFRQQQKLVENQQEHLNERSLAGLGF